VQPSHNQAREGASNGRRGLPVLRFEWGIHLWRCRGKDTTLITERFASIGLSVCELDVSAWLCIGLAQRATEIKVRAQDLQGKNFVLSLKDWRARIFQHEYDHLQVSISQ
jgi:Polypeptide deformylase